LVGRVPKYAYLIKDRHKDLVLRAYMEDEGRDGAPSELEGFSTAGEVRRGTSREEPDGLKRTPKSLAPGQRGNIRTLRKTSRQGRRGLKRSDVLSKI